ncbi:phosphatase [Streptomyces tateyamensis]|uniref:Phosphatase n=1 Tax=Streptomyces tateyamensis TaxID=565073 RepID=A0A2V4NN45_9ACTN|nr:SpoIIE family protein phosphatase [Streptomyces tateyamensis]PYC87620.1 phosphatase [Streptomyces tateyamensis]
MRIEPVADEPGEDSRGTARAVAALAAEVAGLREQLARQHLLDLAAGVLVARLGLEPGQAAEHLLSLARATGQRPADLAADLLNQSTGTTDPADPASVDLLRAPRRAGELAAARETLDEVAETVLSEALAALGATGVLIWRSAAADCLELVGAAGHGPLVRTQWRWLPPAWSTPVRQAYEDGLPRWLDRGPQAGQELPGPPGEAARAVLPLRDEHGPLGVVQVDWPGPLDASRALRREVTAVAEALCRILPRREPDAEHRPAPLLRAVVDVLAHPAMLVHWAADRGELLVECANPAARRTGTALPGDNRPRPLAQFLPFAAPALSRLVGRAWQDSDLQTAPLLPARHRPGAPGSLINVRVVPVDRERAVVLWHSGDLAHRFPILQVAAELAGLGAFEDDLTTGVSHWSNHAFEFFGRPPELSAPLLTELGPLLDPADARELATALGRLTGHQERLTLVVQVRRSDGGTRHLRIVGEPLLTHGTVTGVSGVFQDVSAQYRTEVALSATFDELTSTQEQAAVRHHLALQLQRAIVPEEPGLRKLPGLQVAARYRPAAQEYRVGGDWYDVLPLRDGRVMVAVGDVAGHGIEAATGMVALRNALRGLALTGQSPARLLRWLNELALIAPDRPTATGVCAVYRPDTRELTWCSAGHLPPLLLRGGRARLLEPVHNILLGALPDAEYHESTTQLAAGDTLILFTDGLIERRDDDLSKSLAALRRAAGRVAEAELEEQADRLLARNAGDTDDDSSLIALRIL